MENISKIRSLSLWVFLIPFLTVNLCLIVVIFFQEFIPHGVGIAPTFPYFDGGTSISRTARNFPTNLIFKPGMIITSFLLIKYWIFNKDLLSKIEPLNIKSVNYFYMFGILSAIFLIFHAIFLGIKFDNNFYKLFRKLILLFFIIFEILAQSFLVYNLYKKFESLKELINKKILRFKILLVSTLIIVTIISAPIVAQEGNIKFKHALEWDYFLGVIFFYFLTFLMWKKRN
tara:strand:+ start:1071 stop:1760 length:690 start_codon:yes stop_codon:yes gene_type:complete